MSKGARIAVWEDDPGSAIVRDRAVPDLDKKPLAFAIQGTRPLPDIYATDTPQFRYWAAAEALRRAADLWGPLTGRGWYAGKTLPVVLDAAFDLNAYYTRDSLRFCHGPTAAGGTVWSGESPDIVCHELGHAILDSIRPELWDATSHEAAAFHESFGDISAILSALQLPSVREAVLTETGGKLYRSSRLSRLGEQIGAAVRLFHPDAVEPDCLRNAVNSFTYVDPLLLPQMAPSSMLSSEPHSFSRVFTGAFFEILAGVVDQNLSRAKKKSDDDKALLKSSVDIARMLINGVLVAPLVPNFYAQVAAAMVDASEEIDASYPAILKAAFVRRSILSLHSAAQVQELHKAQYLSTAEAAKVLAQAPLASLSLPSRHYGFDKPLLVRAASHQRSFLATPADTGIGSVEPPSSSTAATSFVDDLFRLGRVHYEPEFCVPGRYLARGNRATSHKLVDAGSGLRLERCRFACGIAH